jgi:hypothetical protein
MKKCSSFKFRTEKVIQSKGDKLLVKRLGYSDAVNSWVKKMDIELIGFPNTVN